MKTVCPQCKGSGEVPVKIDWFAAVFTVGISLLQEINDTKTCNLCHGKGIIDLKD